MFRVESSRLGVTAINSSFLPDFLHRHQLPANYIETVQRWFIPLTEELSLKQKVLNRTLMVGVNGCQGSGKSTLVDFVAEYLSRQEGLSVVVLSLDDFYYSTEKRNQLADSIHPLLRTRGVPGTHDVNLIELVLSQLTKASGEVKLPRFNKAIDNPAPESKWPVVNTPVDIVLFEGWSWGVNAQDDSDLSEPQNGLEREQDQKGRWRRYVNEQIGRYYEPLYAQMDHWVMLKAPSFDQVFQWRLEQEQKLSRKSSGRDSSGVMDEAQVANFVQFFERLTQHALRDLPARCDQVFSLDETRAIVSGKSLPSEN